MAITGIYKIEHIQSGKPYIGSALDMKKRWANHRSLLDHGKHHCQHLQRAWQKYGASAFTFSALLVCKPDDLVFYEQRAIDAFNSYRAGYNASPTAGNIRGYKHTPETSAKMSAAQRGNKKNLGRRHAPETLAKMRTNMLARPDLADHMARLQQISATSRRGKPLAPETKAKLSVAFKGRIVSQETRAKTSAALKGRFVDCKNPAVAEANRQRVWTPEMRAARSALSKALFADPNSGQSRDAKQKAARKAAKRLARRLKTEVERPLLTEKRRSVGRINGLANRGHKASAEAKAKMSAAQMGRKHTAETLAKMSRAQIERFHGAANP